MILCSSREDRVPLRHPRTCGPTAGDDHPGRRSLRCCSCTSRGGHPRGMGLGDDMLERAFEFRWKVLDASAGANGRANYPCSSATWNTMGSSAVRSRHRGGVRLKWDRCARRCRDPDAAPRQDHEDELVQWCFLVVIPPSNLDHVFASDHLKFRVFRRPADGGDAEGVAVRGWVDQPTPAKKDDWIVKYSDHRCCTSKSTTEPALRCRCGSPPVGGCGHRRLTRRSRVPKLAASGQEAAMTTLPTLREPRVPVQACGYGQLHAARLCAGPYGQVHYHEAGPANGVPLVMLHQAPGVRAAVQVFWSIRGSRRAASARSASTCRASACPIRRRSVPGYEDYAKAIPVVFDASWPRPGQYPRPHPARGRDRGAAVPARIDAILNGPPLGDAERGLAGILPHRGIPYHGSPDGSHDQAVQHLMESRPTRCPAR